jgi:hypothetical protein
MSGSALKVCGWGICLVLWIALAEESLLVPNGGFPVGAERHVSIGLVEGRREYRKSPPDVQNGLEGSEFIQKRFRERAFSKDDCTNLATRADFHGEHPVVLVREGKSKDLGSAGGANEAILDRRWSLAGILNPQFDLNWFPNLKILGDFYGPYPDVGTHRQLEGLSALLQSRIGCLGSSLGSLGTLFGSIGAPACKPSLPSIEEQSSTAKHYQTSGQDRISPENLGLAFKKFDLPFFIRIVALSALFIAFLSLVAFAFDLLSAGLDKNNSAFAMRLFFAIALVACGQVAVYSILDGLLG